MKRPLMIFSQVMAVLAAYKVRTAIAVIGVLLGAMALVLVQNISSSLQKKVENDIKSFGDRVFTVYARVPFVPGQMMRREQIKSMKMTDVEAIRVIKNVENVAPVAVRPTTSVKFQSYLTNSNVIGTTSDYFYLKSLTLDKGRLFDENENNLLSKVAVIGTDVTDELFREIENPVGYTIFVGGVTFEVIGVLEKKGSDPRGNSLDNVIIIPVKTILSRVLTRDYLNSIVVQVDNWDNYDKVAGDTELVLRVQHNRSETQKNDFDIVNPADEQELSNTLVNLASLLGSASAAIAFLIGGIGIFSLMLLIVSQRITEIGIKRAIGATKRDILLQFIMESGYIGLMGGLLGIITGCILTVLVSLIGGLPLVISLFGVFTGFFASLLSGMVAGLYPAMRASRIMPVEALRL